MKYADELFEDEKYSEAYPHYLQLLPSYRLNPDVNFKYGTCLLYISEDKSEALPYLNLGASKGTDPRAYFFLGKAYHLMYKFGVASGHYKTFKSKASDADKQKYQVDLHIRMCASGQKLLNHLTELVVEEKTRTSVDKFPYSYDLSQMGGRIIISEEFQSKLDEKKGFRSMTYIPPLGTGNDVIFYASYGKKGDTGLDLYARKRLPNGDWGEEQKLPDHINTPYDDAYGFLHPSKTAFYFCSKGHNSMGGYDIFKSSYDLATNTFGPAVNLDYKINTPDDDIMYVVDSLEQNAYFASGRASKYGFIDVYKVRVETFPLVNVLLAGNFDNKIQPGDNATIKIKDERNDEIIGVYNPRQDGKYTILLPRSGNYTFIVETDNSEKIHQSSVVVPPQKEFRPLKQKIILTNESGVEQLIIQNLFDEEFTAEEREALLADAMQSMADPQVNIDEFQDVLTQEDKDSVLAMDDNFTLDDIEGMAKEFYEDAQEEADKLKDKMEAAFAVANQKSKEAAENAAAAEEILSSLDEIENPLERQQQADLAKELNNKAKDQYMMATTAYNLANGLKSDYESAQNEALESKATYESIQATIAEEDHEKAIAQLTELKERIEEIITENPDSGAGDEIYAQSKAKKEEANAAMSEAQEFRAEEEKLNLRIGHMKEDLAKAKEKDKAAIQVQIDELEEQAAMNKKWAEESYAKAERLDQEAMALDHQAQLLMDLDSDIASSSGGLSESEVAELEKFMSSNNLESGIESTEDALTAYADENGNAVADNNEGTNNLTNKSANGNENGTDNETNEGNEGNDAEVTNNGTEANNTGNEATDGNTSETNESNTGNETESNEVANTTTEGNESVNESGNSNESETNEGNETATESGLTPSALVEGAQSIVDENELANIDNDPNLTTEEKLEKQNEVLQEWVDKYDYKIVEANKGLLESESQEDRERFLEVRKEFESERNDLENRIAENNEKIANQTIASASDNISDEYQELINETESEVNDPEDYSSDLSETEAYFSDKAAEMLSEKENEREELSVKEDELAQLEEDYENESKEKKREKIQTEIDQKEEEILNLKNDLGASIYEVDGVEMEQNDTELVNLIDEVTSNVDGFESDENYLKAEIFNETAESQRRDADDKVEQASKTTDAEEKASLLEEAHTLNSAAIDNQREAISLLEDMTSEDYVASNIPLEKSDSELAENNTSNGSETNKSGTTDQNTTESNNGGVVENENGNQEGTDTENETANNTSENSNGSNVENGANTSENNGSETESNEENTNVADNNTTNGSENETNSTESNELTNNTETAENNTNQTSNNEEGNTSETNSESGNSTEGNELASNNTTSSNSNAGTNSSSENQNKSVSIEAVNEGATSVSNLLTQTEKQAVQNVPDQEVLDKTYDAENDNPDAYEVSTEVEDITYSNRTTDFNSEAADEVFKENEKVVEKINDLESEKTSLNVEAQNTTSDKEREKLDKKVDKIDDKIEKQESKLHEDIQEIAEAKVEASKNNLEVVKESFGDIMVDESTNKKQSDEYEAKADELVASAKDLRGEAETEKDKSSKNELLKEANSKELEAANYYDKAADLYVDAAFGQQEDAVANNQSAMSSEEMAAKADDLRSKSSELMNESIASRDSALLAKGEEKIKMIQRAEDKEKQANTLAVIANEYKKTSEKQLDKEEETREKEELLANLSPDDADKVKSLDEYKDYFEAENEKNQLKVQKAQKEGEKEGLENIVLQQSQDLKQLENDLQGVENKQEEAAIKEEIDVIEDAIISNEEKIDELDEAIESLDVLIESAESNQDNLIASLPSEQQDDIKAVMVSNYDKNPVQKAPTFTTGDLASANFVVPDKISGDIIVLDQNIKYSDDNPIPLNPKYPDGLIYKVQVGAFSKPIPNDVFSGFAPISGEQIGNSGLVRYRVGYFVRFDNADNAKNEIRGFGYSDAFVVAVYNGEKITIAEAKNIEQESGVVTLASNATTNQNNGGNSTEESDSNNQNNNTNTTNNNGGNNVAVNNGNNATSNTGNNTNGNNGGNNGNETTNNDVIVDLGNGAALTTNADKVEGLFYTVQLGAFSNPIQATDVYNISPLVTKFVGNLYKYSTGIYRSVDDAVVRKNEVVALGNTDAFVTVYYNGERITVAKAQELINEQGEAVFASSEDGQLKQLSGGNNATSENNDNQDVTPSGSLTPDGLLEAAMNIVSESEINRIKNDNSLTEKEKLEKQNEVIQDWVDKFDYKIVEANKGILESDNSADRDGFLEVRKQFEVERNILEERIAQNNDKLSNLSAADNTSIEIVEVSEDGEYYVDLGTYEGEIPTDVANAMLMVPEYTVEVVSRGAAEQYYVGFFNSKEDAQKVIDLYASKGVSHLSIASMSEEETSSGPAPYPGVEYRVFLGNYQGEVPAARAITFVDLKDEGVEKKFEDDGSETYYAGRSLLFRDAETVKKKFTSRGVSIAEVKAFKDGVEIPVDEAKQLTHE